MITSQPNPLFKGRKLLIVTKHKKEKVLQPLLENNLGVLCSTTEHFDTDVFGTFSGEVERTDDPLNTVIAKCKSAMDKEGYDLAIASEGSFGPHPSLFFISADDELLVLIDSKNSLQIVVREISMSTNFSGSYITSIDALYSFAKKALFPSHALIIRPTKESKDNCIKGITAWHELLNFFEDYQRKFGTVFVETDMRALYNPTRMNVIQEAAKKLIQKIASTCPVCTAPGFDVVKANTGLPCSVCGQPTNSIYSYTFLCEKCGHRKETFFPHHIQKADPATCNHCNP